MSIRRATAEDFKRCSNCAHFYQHYYLPKYLPREFTPANCGHCYGTRRRCVKPDYVCESFISKETPPRENSTELHNPPPEKNPDSIGKDSP